ncbi:MAG: FG-GAP-like repeat-containing protein, partial [Balneolaceae bacterium]|nr:FG-GAP-like repeat-containing protein [Balneolaceae bacterium]
HISRSSMGNDIADMNNDGRPDIYVADMLPMTEEGLKQSVSSESYKVYKIKREFGYHPQYIQNTLQINLGENPEGEMEFAEIAKYSGIEATDWSWATLFFDMDNSGQKDLFITNGIYRRPNDLDYLLYVRMDATQGKTDTRGKRNPMDIIAGIPHTKVNNVGFINNGNFTFSDLSVSLGFGEPSYSNGAAYGDLDADGDLDLVINNVNSPVSIYRNMTRERNEGNFLSIKLKGDNKNTDGLGSKVMVYDSSSVQLYEMFTSRGFQSSVEPKLTIGLGHTDNIDSLSVIWPDKRKQTLTDVESNQSIILRQSETTHIHKYVKKQGDFILKNVTSDIGMDYTHEEDSFLDYNQQQLAPYMLSNQGPCLTKGDINNDGYEDFFVCGAKDQPGEIFLQQSDDKFVHLKVSALEMDAQFEDVDAVMFDANGDKFLDLYVISGGNEYPVGSKAYSDRLYLNRGGKDLIRMKDALPTMYENGAAVAAADYDKDGDIDLFIGNRTVPQNYGISPNSYLLQNQGNGQFVDVTNQVAPFLNKIGMVTDAKWDDIDGNQYLDLVVVGEWMPVKIFYNSSGNLSEADQNEEINKLQGLWQSVATGDYDKDGDIDLIAGNMGTNSSFKTTEKEPIIMYLKDFNGDGQIDPIIGYTQNNYEYPIEPRDELLTQFKFLRSKYRSYNSYAGETIQDIFENRLDKVTQKQITSFLETVLIENTGDKNFKVTSLPAQIQWAPVHAIEQGDFNRDGHIDLLLGGNFYEVKPSYGGQYDASYGWLLEGTGKLEFNLVENSQSGFNVKGEIRDIETITNNEGQPLIIVARNGNNLKFFTLQDNVSKNNYMD